MLMLIVVLIAVFIIIASGCVTHGKNIVAVIVTVILATANLPNSI